MRGDRELPAPDWRRCDAMAKHTDFRRDRWNARAPHRCGNYATRWRDGYQLCPQHFELANDVRYAPDAHRFRRFREYAAMMAVALGDEAQQ